MQLRSLHGVSAVTLIHADPRGNANGFPQGLIACSDLATTPEIGRCATSGVISLPLYALDAGHSQPNTTWPAATNLRTTIAALPVLGIVVATDAASATLERIRTTIETAAPAALSVPRTLSQLSAAALRDVSQLQHLADLAILLSVLIAGCSLAVAVVGGLLERQRPFSQLRLNGTPLKVLRRVVLLEAAVPLIGLAIVSAAGRPTHRDTATTSRPRRHHPPARQHLLPHPPRRNRHCPRPRNGNNASPAPDQLTGKRANRIGTDAREAWAGQIAHRQTGPSCLIAGRRPNAPPRTA